MTLFYIDPAATTALVSALTAIVAAVGASAIILWRRAKNKIKKVVKIDENKNKEVEEDIVIKDEEGK